MELIPFTPDEGADHVAIEEELLKAFDEIPFGNTHFQIVHFILNHESPERVYRQALLEIKKLYEALKAAQFRRRRLAIQIRQLEKKQATEKDSDEAELIGIDIEEKQHSAAMEDTLIKDAIVEIQTYYDAFKQLKAKFGHLLTREEFEKSEATYWPPRLLRQAERDMMTMGRITQGNIEALGQIGLDVHATEMEIRKGVEARRQQLLGEGKVADKPAE